MTRLLARAAIAAALSVAFSLALAQPADTYPNRLVRIVVPFPPGDGSDRVARILAEVFQRKWGQTVIVENRVGSGGNIGTDAVAKAPPDGYTLLFTPQFTLVINKSLYPKLSYDPDTLVPVSISVAGDLVLLAHPKMQVNTVQELIAAAKANPEKINYASPGIGSIGHLVAEYFNTKAGVKITHVPYKGGTPALMDLLGGQVDIMFVALGPTVQHVRSGKVRALAVAAEKRNPALPDTPTFADVLPDFNFPYWFGMAAPPGTPPAITHKLSAAIAEALAQPEVVQRLGELNLRVVGSTPEKMAQTMAQERERWSAIVRTSGATAE